MGAHNHVFTRALEQITVLAYPGMQNWLTIEAAMLSIDVQSATADVIKPATMSVQEYEIARAI